MTEFEIFRSCFPSLEISEGDFSFLTRHGTRFAADGAFAVVEGDRLDLLCVAPEMRRRGVGSGLLRRCEEFVARDHSELHIGGELICGAVCESVDFFAKRGYSIGGQFCEMYIDIADYSDTLPLSEDRFGFLSGRRGELIAAVNSVDEEWAQYFRDGEIFCGFGADGEIESFCIVDEEVRCAVGSDRFKTGSVGCVGTIPAARGRGTGLKMVSLALEELRRRGCGRCFIHWTHLDKWYGKLGAHTAYKFCTAQKRLRR